MNPPQSPPKNTNSVRAKLSISVSKHPRSRDLLKRLPQEIKQLLPENEKEEIFVTDIFNMANEEDIPSLVRLMREMGSTCSSNENFSELLDHTNTTEISNQTVTDILSLILDSNENWDVEVVMNKLAQLENSWDWNEIIAPLLEDTSFISRNLQSITVLMTAFRSISDLSTFPVHLFTSKWSNTSEQLIFLKHCIHAYPDVFQSDSLKKIVSIDQTPANRTLSQQLYSQPFNALDLLSILLELWNQEPDVKILMDYACQHCPELIALGICQITEWSEKCTELADTIIPLFLLGHSNSSYVLPRIWNSKKDIFKSQIIKCYNNDATVLSRILDVSQELKILPEILELTPFSFCIDLAALASRRDFLNLEKWVVDNIKLSGQDFIKAVLDFLNEKAVKKDLSVPLSKTTTQTFLKVLKSNESIMSTENKEYFKELVVLTDYINGGVFDVEIEEEALNYFGKMYSSQISVPDLLALMKKLKFGNPRQVQVFKCMVQSILEEYNSFVGHPEHVLVNITAVFFGGLILDVLEGGSLGVALRCVLESLRGPTDGKLFKFGVKAITVFKERLHEWPHYFELVKSNKSILSAIPEFDDNEKTPNEETMDKIYFIVNNLTTENVDSKTEELKVMLETEHYKWFSNYLVVKRVIIEPNYHGVYLKLLDGVGKELSKMVLEETVERCKVYLKSEKALTVSSERVLLKNLGAWLGMFTLARNKPIKHKHLSFKELLVQGYASSRLIVVIPFVCKVLEQCVDSKVFKPPNPWTVGILKVLAELYMFGDLKTGLQFPIDVLCKGLGVDITTIPPSNLIRNLRAQQELSAEPELHVTTTSPRSNAGTVISEEGGGIPNIASLIVFNPNIALFATQPNAKRAVHLAIDRAIREIIGPVVERSVTIATIATRELILKDFVLEPNEEKMRRSAQLMVASLSGSLAAVTGREPLRISMSSQLRAVFGPELAISDHSIIQIVNDNLDLACSILEHRASEKAIPEIEESLSAAFKARKLHRDRNPGQPFCDLAVYTSSRYPNTLPEALRLKVGGLSAAQFRVYEDFAKKSVLPGQPEQIRPKMDGTGTVFPGQQPANGYEEGTGVAPQIATGTAQIQSAIPPIQPPALAQQALGFGRSIVQTAEKIVQLLKKLEENFQTVSTANPSEKLATLQPTHELVTFPQQIPALVLQSYNPADAALLVTQKLIKLAGEYDFVIVREVVAGVVEKLVEGSKRVKRECCAWWLYSEDERKYNIPITQTLLLSNLITVTELDMQLSRIIESEKPGMVEFVAGLLRRCVLEESIATQNDFLSSIEGLKWSIRSERKEIVVKLLEDLRKRTFVKLKDEAGSDETAGLRDQLSLLFTEWVKLYVHPASNEKSQASFIKQLQQQGILNGEETYLFFRVCTEMSVESYLKLKAAGAPNSTVYQAIDAFARLIVLLVLHSPDHNQKNKLTTNVLSIIVLVLVHSHEQKQSQFNQRPFLRLFSTLLTDLEMYEKQLESIYFQMLSQISLTFHSLKPTFLPGFTFSWLQLVSHRYFMPKLLMPESQKGWPLFQTLMVDLFKFLQPHLRQGELSESVRLLYKGTLRILLLLLHDVPEFLCDYHFSFVDVIPHNCIQLRNLILSAFPHSMKLPDPFTPDLKVDLLPEINQPPHVLSDYTHALIANNFKVDVDNFLKNRGPVTFLSDLKTRLENSAQQQVESGFKYNIQLINSLVLYVGVQAIMQNSSRTATATGATTTTTTVAALVKSSAHTDIFQHLVTNMDTEGRYFFLSAIANQLRYPNSHTHYFSCVLLQLFSEAGEEIIQEQITRVLLERLIVNRPHPYGLLITFLELIRNADFNFWQHDNFIRCAPEIEQLFTEVAKSIHAGR